MPTQPTSKPSPLLIAAVALIVIGALGPWVTIDADDFGNVPGLDTSESGLESDGVITLILGLIAAAVLVLVRKPMVRRVAAGICAGLTLIIAIIDFFDVTGTEVLGIEPSVGWGLIATLIGAILLVAAVVMSFGRSSTTVSA